jgi:hypothetical protein
MTWIKSTPPDPPPPFAFEGGECMSIGISHKLRHSAYGMTGWLPTTIGYHSDDGYVYENGLSIPIGDDAKWGPGDTVGCGVSIDKRIIFFTKNGRIVFMKALGHEYAFFFPCIGFHTLEKMHLNFGHRPFLWNLVSTLRPCSDFFFISP